MAFDTAISEAAAAESELNSPVAGKADILLVPDLEVGQILVQQLESLAGVRAAGQFLGARLPIIFAGPSDSVGTVTASCALAQLLSREQRAREEASKTVRPLPRA